jgi:N6-adenosine-specific RNA methylase IME4
VKFGLVLADPPWKNSAGKGANSTNKVDGHSTDEYASVLSNTELFSLPVESVVADDAYLFLWVDAQHAPYVPSVASSWGFEQFATKLTWVKTTPTGKQVGGIGRYIMIASEDCWVFKRGKPSFVSTAFQSPFYAQRGKHSRKPETMYEFIEATHSKGQGEGRTTTMWPSPRLELFARTHAKGVKLWEPRPGWTQAGNEFEGPEGLGEDIVSALQRIAAM